MKTLTLLALVSLALTGCLVDGGPRRTTIVRERGGCGPAYHWEDGACVHNGRAEGHYKHDDDDHGHGHGHGHDR